MLLKPGLERADRDGVPTYLEATPEGARVYPKFGFQKVNELEMFGGRFVMEMHIRASPDEHVAKYASREQLDQCLALEREGHLLPSF